MGYNIFKDYSSRLPIPEEVLKQKPTNTEFKFVREILSDFGINKRIDKDDFNSILELRRWMQKCIDEHLS